MRNERMYLVAALLCGGGGLLGCSSGGNVNIGDTSTVGAKLSDYAASWDGYAQAYSFWPNGSDRVRLTIDATGQGTLRVGDAPLIPAPTDPDVFNPPNIVELPDWSNLVEGGLYPTHVPEVQAGRIQLRHQPVGSGGRLVRAADARPCSGWYQHRRRGRRSTLRLHVFDRHHRQRHPGLQLHGA